VILRNEGVVSDFFEKISSQIWVTMHEWIGTSVVFLGALTPFPFDVVTFIAGFSKFPVKLYTVGCFVGKLVKFVIIMMFGNALLAYFF